ncbi:hypothetical protein GWN42_05440, partial [candidate division KSB1 bacterium]|nr:hypothetical protein [candidate division KSB1 bacterium]NIS24109.1 hypothetical protein [candidate division KSB1 bacterium]NIU24728.1 hypothetical protein [candidate division KSB1 bacterium]NIU89329.1 hypothetical protein [candidate division KSB1 bacterium]NIV92244.1 hypothetical protein [candidate division KSB1 bacterium]
MRKSLLFLVCFLLSLPFFVFAQADWTTEYVTFDDALNGTGDQTPSVAVVGPNRFVAIVTMTPESPVLENLFNPPGNYLVGYWDADSANGRVNSPIDKQDTQPQYNVDGQYTHWTSGLDEIQLTGAWQIADGPDNHIYVANNDEFHNILVFQLTENGVVTTDFRMETGSENIYAIEVDTA